MKIKKRIQQNRVLRILLYLLVGIPVGLLMVNNDVLLGLGILLLFVKAFKICDFKKNK
ncbi:hypothetical protein [Vagococcus acidifermentans]|uniref:hypothetical protein n=1 Tax=Vagococcus acidifermentans TaxID=564710 RepID=UPI0014768BF9|nr:hypothetical protein [Vagococcus acidifermentans]